MRTHANASPILLVTSKEITDEAGIQVWEKLVWELHHLVQVLWVDMNDHTQQINELFGFDKASDANMTQMNLYIPGKRSPSRPLDLDALNVDYISDWLATLSKK